MESEHLIPNLSLPLLDLDLTPSGSWVGVIGIPNEDERRVVIAGREIPLRHSCRFPIIRALGDDRVVLVNARSSRGEKNASIITPDGEVQRQFAAGDGIKDVLTSKSSIVVTYFDEGVFGKEGPNKEGLSVFNSTGDFIFGYNSRFGAKTLDIADCYCACWEANNVLLFLPYTSFSLVRLDISTVAQEVFSTPREVHGAGAITSVRGKQLYFHGSYDHKNEIVAWGIGQGKVTVVGKHHGPLRGLPSGAFLAVGDRGYSTMSLA